MGRLVSTGTLSALVAAALTFVSAAGGQVGAVACTGSLSGTTVETLVVPDRATCHATGVRVTKGVLVGRGATLDAEDLVVGRGITVAAGGALSVTGQHVEVGGNVFAPDAFFVELTRSGLLGSTARVGGNVVVGGAEDGVAVFGLTIVGNLLVYGSGAENGVGIGGNDIGGSAALVGNTIVGAHRPSAIDVFGNTVGDHLLLYGNDATNAFEPTFVGSNVVETGNLACFANVPDVVNDPPGGPYPNTVLVGRKLGQCAAL